MSRAGDVAMLACLTLVLTMSPPSARAGETGADGAAPKSQILRRMEKLEARVVELEAEVARLRSERSATTGALDSSKEGPPSQPKAERVAMVWSRPLSAPVGRPETEEQARGSAFDLGTRVGYQGFPFGQKGGGFFYSFFFDHSLLASSIGDLYAEIALGYGRSGSDHLTVTSVVLGEPENIEFRQTILALWPGLKFYPTRLTPAWLRPYVAGGPGIWGDIIETPPLFIGQAPEAPELAPRKLPIDGAASIFSGAHGGAGIEISLAPTKISLLEPVSVGFDYRYTAWTTGQRFNTYTFALSYRL